MVECSMAAFESTSTATMHLSFRGHSATQRSLGGRPGGRRSCTKRRGWLSARRGWRASRSKLKCRILIENFAQVSVAACSISVREAPPGAAAHLRAGAASAAPVCGAVPSTATAPSSTMEPGVRKLLTELTIRRPGGLYAAKADASRHLRICEPDRGHGPLSGASASAPQPRPSAREIEIALVLRL